MRKSRYCNISTCICTKCGNKMYVPRRSSAKREHGHIKDLYCPFCDEVVKTKEIKGNEFYKNGLGEIVYS